MEADIYKVLYIILNHKPFSGFNRIGGHVAHIYGIIRSLSKVGFDIDIISNENLPEFIRNIKGVNLHTNRNRRFRIIYLLDTLRTLIKLKNNYKYKFIYIRYAMKSAPILFFYRIIFKNIPIVLEVNSFASINYKFFRKFEFLAMNNADFIICISEELKNCLLNIIGYKLSGKVYVIENGVFIEDFEVARFNDIKNEKFRLCYIGILKNDYGIEEVIAAYKILKNKYIDMELHIVGDGPIKRKLELLCKNIADVYFYGNINRESIPQILRNMDVAICPATRKTIYNSPIKLYEYMASGKAIIAAKTPSIMKIINKNNCGLLYEIGDVEDLCRCCEKYYEDRDFLKKKGEAAYEAAKRRYSWEGRVEYLLNILDKNNNT